MRSFLVVFLDPNIEVILHLNDVLVEFGSTLDAQVLVEQRAMEAFKEAIALRPANLGGSVFNFLELQEELVGMPIGPAAELAPVV